MCARCYFAWNALFASGSCAINSPCRRLKTPERCVRDATEAVSSLLFCFSCCSAQPSPQPSMRRSRRTRGRSCSRAITTSAFSSARRRSRTTKARRTGDSCSRRRSWRAVATRMPTPSSARTWSVTRGPRGSGCWATMSSVATARRNRRSNCSAKSPASPAIAHGPFRMRRAWWRSGAPPSC